MGVARFTCERGARSGNAMRGLAPKVVWASRGWGLEESSEGGGSYSGFEVKVLAVLSRGGCEFTERLWSCLGEYEQNDLMRPQRWPSIEGAERPVWSARCCQSETGEEFKRLARSSSVLSPVIDLVTSVPTWANPLKSHKISTQSILF
jgi:hypothetical protein